MKPSTPLKPSARRKSKPATRKPAQTVKAKLKVKTPSTGLGDPAAAPPPDVGLRLNLADGRVIPIPLDESNRLKRQAMRWTYVLRNRERWNAQPDDVIRHERQIVEFAESIGLHRELCASLAEVGLVEVDVPWTAEAQNWEMRIFPWEYLLAAATRRYRGRNALTVVRRLRVSDAAPPVAPAPKNWLHILSAPAPLGDRFDFTSEEELLKLSVRSLEGTLQLLRDPDSSSLAATVAARSPDVIHLSGFDTHQGATLLAGTPTGEALRQQTGEPVDGYLVRPAEAGQHVPEVLDDERLAAALTGGSTQRPRLVACNFYNSAARIAPLVLASGAEAALGFQDNFDDALAELFFTTFYRAWHHSEWDLAAAFQFAWGKVREANRPLNGSGIVLWSRRSILDAPQTPVAATRATVQEKISSDLASQTATQVTPETARACLAVTVKVEPQLNYSLLHNKGKLFKEFAILKTNHTVGAVDDLRVQVVLHAGSDAFPFRMNTAIPQGQLSTIDLQDRIHLSLASNLTRAIRESIRSSMLVEVSWGDVPIYQETHRVTLLPVDEWRFDAEVDRWLPSFVLPRDPAVLKVIDSAQRYLMSLRDDATAGFDGYQCVAPEAPGEVTVQECLNVDMQVRAIWSALLYETPLSYINPPPVFTGSSQRLRTPSDCIDGRRGTCIDLALLLAACLEYVEIYPAVVLLKTHAFPAYWRHESYHRRFRAGELSPTPGGSEAPTQQPIVEAGQEVSWQFRKGQYREIMGAVRLGWLVPLETTLVTGRGGFADALAEGSENLASKREFDSMLDITLARTDETTSVTPLPIRRAEA